MLASIIPKCVFVCVWPSGLVVIELQADLDCPIWVALQLTVSDVAVLIEISQ